MLHPKFLDAPTLAEHFSLAFSRAGWPERYAKHKPAAGQGGLFDWKEEDHPRGQPDNAGEFAKKGQNAGGAEKEPMEPITLYRAADDDTIVDCASFAESRDVAKAYLDNPGFGGRTIYRTTVQPEKVLDLVDEDDPVQALADAVNMRHPGAIGADEWAPRISEKIAAAGYDWVRVRESYPQETTTWLWVGGDEPELEEDEEE